MNKNIAFINIDKLKSHESINKKKLTMVVKNLIKTGLIKKPVVVDKRTLVILDGHHRIAALKKLKINHAPVRLVDYFSDKIKVYLRRKSLLMYIIKYAVIGIGLSEKLFPEKSTRHVIGKTKKINCQIKNLT